MRFVRRHRRGLLAALIVALLATATWAADTKVSALTVLGSANMGDDDLVYVVDDPNGTPASRKIGRHEFLLRTLSETLADTSDVTAFITDDDMPAAGTDPDVDAAGELGRDTDGANEPNDVILRVTDTGGDEQYALAMAAKEIFTKTIVKPNDFADATRDLAPLWINGTGMTMTIREIRAWSDTDDTSVNLELVTATDFTGLSTVDALEIATDGTGVYYVVETTITDATIAHDEGIIADFDDTDDPGWVIIQVRGTFNADVD